MFASRHLVPLVFSAACMACSPASPPRIAADSAAGPQAQRSPRATACNDTLSGDVTRDSEEARLLAQSTGSVVRRGCRLVFLGALGEELTLDDVYDDGGAQSVHRYRGRVEGLTAHLVQRSFYEGGTYLLVFPGGGLIDVAGPPQTSPDGSRFAAWSMDLVAGYVPNALEVWRVTPGGARLEIALRSQEWGPSDVRWGDTSTVAFTQNFPTTRPDSTRRGAARLERVNGRWTMQLATP